MEMFDEGFTFVGGTHSFDIGNGDAWIVRTDEIGNIVWNHTVGDPYGNSAQACVYEGNSTYTVAGGTIKVGEPFSDIWVFKVYINEIAPSTTPSDTSPNVGFIMFFEVIFIAVIVYKIKIKKHKMQK